MTQSQEQEIRKEMLKLQLEKLQKIVKAQEIVVSHLDEKIAERDSATVAAMAEILKI